MLLFDLRVLSFVTIVVIAVALIILERIMPYTKGQKFFREGFWDDFVWYTLVQSYFCGLVISFIIEMLDAGTGWSQYKIAAQYPLWAQILFFLVLHDFYIYCFHRLQHRSAYLWRIHEAHHSNRSIDWLAGSRSHVLEIMINQTIEFAPIVLLGASPEIAVLKGVIDAGWGMYIHSNIDVRSGKLQYIINGPEMHRWHHSAEDEAHNKNFSTKLAIWDWIFGTAYLPSGRKPRLFGFEEDFPQGYLHQQAYAFRRDSENQK